MLTSKTPTMKSVNIFLALAAMLLTIFNCNAQNCTSPSGLQVTEIGPHQAHLQWNESGHHYLLRGKIISSLHWTYVNRSASHANELYATNLKNGSTYHWQIKALCSIEDTVGTAWSALDSFVTGCQSPDTAWADIIGWHQVALNWTPSAGASKYEVRGRQVGQHAWKTFTTSGAVNSLHLNCVFPGTNYEWAVRTWCDPLATRRSPWCGLVDFSIPAMNRHSTNSSFGQEKADNLKVIISPNPMRDETKVSFSQHGNFNWVFADLSGRIVQAGTTKDDQHFSLNRGDLLPGVYLLQISNSQFTFEEKVVVQ